MNLQALRDYVRTQLDVDEEELPNSLVDSYLNEAFTRTIALEKRWPFYEQRWTVTQELGADRIELPADTDGAGIMALIDNANGFRLMQIANEAAEDNFIGMQATASNPSYYSVYGHAIILWPKLVEGTEPRSYLLRGYRLSHDWIADGAGAVPDADSRLHRLLAHYAIALAYAQQEDEVLEDTYMKRWQADFVAVHTTICAPRHHRPLVFNVGLPYQPNTNPVVWASPPVGP